MNFTENEKKHENVGFVDSGEKLSGIYTPHQAALTGPQALVLHRNRSSRLPEIVSTAFQTQNKINIGILKIRTFALGLN